MKNDRKMQKILQKIWSCQKKVVILQPFCVCSARGREKTYYKSPGWAVRRRLIDVCRPSLKQQQINGIQFLQDSVCKQGYR